MLSGVGGKTGLPFKTVGKQWGTHPRALGRTILLLTGNNRAELHGSTGFATHKSGLPQPRVARFTGTANLVADSRT